MGGFGGLFAGLSRGFGGRLLQRSDEEREEQRRFYERQENLLTTIATDPSVSPEAAETAWRTLGNLNSEQMKRSGIKGKDLPNYYQMMAEMSRTGRTPSISGPDPNQPSQDTGVPSMFSTEGAHLPGAGPGGPMSPISTGQQPVSPQRTPNFAERQGIQEFRGIRRNPVYDQVVAAEAKANFDAEQKAIEDNAFRQRIYGEVNAGRMTPEAGARAIAARDMGFPLPNERAAQAKGEYFVDESGKQYQFFTEGEAIPAGWHRPGDVKKGPQTDFEKRYADKLAELQASNPGITETDAHTQVMAALGQEDKQKQAKAELDRKNAEALLASRQRAATEKAETGTLTSTTARTILSTALGVANRKVQAFTDYNARPKDPKEAAQYDARVEEIFNSEFASAVELQSGMGVAEVQAIVKARPGDSSGSGRSARYRTK